MYYYQNHFQLNCSTPVIVRRIPVSDTLKRGGGGARIAEWIEKTSHLVPSAIEVWALEVSGLVYYEVAFYSSII